MGSGGLLAGDGGCLIGDGGLLTGDGGLLTGDDGLFSRGGFLSSLGGSGFCWSFLGGGMGLILLLLFAFVKFEGVVDV